MTPIYAKAATMASLIDIAESTFRNLVTTGQLPKPVKIGGNSLWKVEAVVEAIDDRGRSPEHDPVRASMEEYFRKEKEKERHKAEAKGKRK